MKRRLLLLLVLLALPHARGADDGATASVPPPITDPAVVEAHYRQVAERPEFRETEETLADLHWGDWLSQWLRHLVSRYRDYEYAGQLSTAARALVVIIAALALAGLVFVLTRLTRRRRRLGEPDPGFSSSSETLLTPRQYEAQLRRALEKQDWHGAWQAAWLHLLSRLENRQLVAPDRSRTNREYLAQLQTHSLPVEAVPLLAGMIDDYDHTIYGARFIDEAGWMAFQKRIDEATLMLGLRERSKEEPS